MSTPTVYRITAGKVTQIKEQLLATIMSNFSAEIVPNAYVLQEPGSGKMLSRKAGIWTMDVTEAMYFIDTPVELMGTLAVPMGTAAQSANSKLQDEIEDIDLFLVDRSNYVHL